MSRKFAVTRARRCSVRVPAPLCAPGFSSFVDGRVSVSAFSPVDKPVDDARVRPIIGASFARRRIGPQESLCSRRAAFPAVNKGYQFQLRAANTTPAPAGRFIVRLFGEFACIVRRRGTEISRRPVRADARRSRHCSQLFRSPRRATTYEWNYIRSLGPRLRRGFGASLALARSVDGSLGQLSLPRFGRGKRCAVYWRVGLGRVCGPTE